MNRWILLISRLYRNSEQCRKLYGGNSYRLCSSASAYIQTENQSTNGDVDFSHLEKLWIWDANSDGLNQFLFKKFSVQRNSYSYTLSLISQTIQLDTSKHSDLAFEILLCFSKWLSENSLAAESLNIELKQQALELALSLKDKPTVQLMCDLFKLSQDRNILKAYADKLIADGKHYDASHCAIVLGIQEEIPLEKVLLPLVFESKYGLAIKYLNGCPTLQLNLAKKIDDIIGNANSDSILKYGNARTSVKHLCKFLSKMLKIFSIDPETCPNLRKAKGFGTLNFMLRKRLESSEPYNILDEKILAMCKEKPELQKSLLCKLVFLNDIKSAYKFAMALDVPKSEWPQDLLKNEKSFCLDSFPSLVDSAKKSEPTLLDRAQDFLTFDQDKTAIQLISNEKEFFDCLDDILKNHNVVCLDSEWKPQLSKSDKTRLSLIQMAVKDKVYILDLISLGPSSTCHHYLLKLVEGLFGNPEIIKLGCGIMQDVQMLIDEVIVPDGQAYTFSHLVDISFLYEKMSSLYEDEISDEDSVYSGMKGLSKLCEIVLGKPLNKEVRICDWEERPLLESRILYAALDANCLLQMFEKLKSRAEKSNFNFEHQLNKAMVMTTAMTKSLKVKSGYRLSPGYKSFSFVPFVYVQDLKFAVDFSFREIGLQLRMFGADVKIFSQSEALNNEGSLKLANSEERILLCDEENREKAQKIFPESRVYVVEDIDKHNKSPAHIFKHFNVKIERKAIFSRCMECNCNEFLKISAEDLQTIWNNSVSHERNTEDSSKEVGFVCDNMHMDWSGVMNNGVKIQLDKLKQNMLMEQENFRICRTCGNIATES